MQGCCLRAREIDRPHVTRSTEEISRHSSAVTVSGPWFVSGQLHIVNLPVRLEVAQLMVVNEFDRRAEPALHLDVVLQPCRFIRMHDADKSSFTKVSWPPTTSCQF
jgi:hypothetical protein